MTPPAGLNDAGTLGNALLMFQPDGAERLPTGELGSEGQLDVSVFDTEARGQFEAMIAHNPTLKGLWDREVIGALNHYRGRGNTEGESPNIIAQAEFARAFAGRENADVRTRNTILNLQMAVGILNIINGQSPPAVVGGGADNRAPGLLTAGTLGNAYLMFSGDADEVIPTGQLTENRLDISIFDRPVRQQFEAMIAENPDLQAQWQREVIAAVDYYRGRGNTEGQAPNTVTLDEFRRTFTRNRRTDETRVRNTIMNLQMAVRILEGIERGERPWVTEEGVGTPEEEGGTLGGIAAWWESLSTTERVALVATGVGIVIGGAALYHQLTRDPERALNRVSDELRATREEIARREAAGQTNGELEALRRRIQELEAREAELRRQAEASRPANPAEEAPAFARAAQEGVPPPEGEAAARPARPEAPRGHWYDGIVNFFRGSGRSEAPVVSAPAEGPVVITDPSRQLTDSRPPRAHDWVEADMIGRDNPTFAGEGVRERHAWIGRDASGHLLVTPGEEGVVLGIQRPDGTVMPLNYGEALELDPRDIIFLTDRSGGPALVVEEVLEGHRPIEALVRRQGSEGQPADGADGADRARRTGWEEVDFGREISMDAIREAFREQGVEGLLERLGDRSYENLRELATDLPQDPRLRSQILARVEARYPSIPLAELGPELATEMLLADLEHELEAEHRRLEADIAATSELAGRRRSADVRRADRREIRQLEGQRDAVAGLLEPLRAEREGSANVLHDALAIRLTRAMRGRGNLRLSSETPEASRARINRENGILRRARRMRAP